MTEIEQLRQEVNELRERVAILDKMVARMQPIQPNTYPPGYVVPVWPSIPNTFPYRHDIWCKSPEPSDKYDPHYAYY